MAAITERFFGATVWRVANRIAGASFPLDGRTVRLEPNEGPNHLHGTFSHRVFERIDGTEATGQLFRDLCSAGIPARPEDAEAAGEMPRDPVFTGNSEGPENPEAAVLLLRYTSPDGEGDILGHTLRIDADAFCEIGADMIPTGRLLPAAGTPFDFRKPKPLGRDIVFLSDPTSETKDINDPGDAASAENTNDPRKDAAGEMNLYRTQLRLAGGYDHSLEAQHHPDAPHHPAFPPIVLRPGEPYRQTTVYRLVMTERTDNPVTNR